MKCSEIMAKLEELSPLSFAESWDNVGLLVGSREREVESVMIALVWLWRNAVSWRSPLKMSFPRRESAEWAFCRNA